MQVTIRPDESVTIFGRKGSGKTSLLNWAIDSSVIRGTHRKIILDTKQVGDFSRFPAVQELKDLHKLTASNPVCVYAPHSGEAHDRNFMDAFFAWAYERWNTCVIVDELSSIVWGNDVPDSYKDITDRGRAKHVVLWQSNQKPVYVPHAAISEADHYFTFDLQYDKDRDKVAGIVGSKMLKQRPPDPHGFFYYYKSMRDSIYCPGLNL